MLDAEGLSPEAMLSVAREFIYSETTFVLPAGHDAHVRIFTPSREVPFAGHPNLGTAAVLAWEAQRAGAPVPDALAFDEAAGLVRVELTRDGSAIAGARLSAPEALSRRSEVDPAAAAACLSIRAEEVRTDVHHPVVASVGLPFLVVELASRDALRRVAPDGPAFRRWLPLDGATAIYAYLRGEDARPSGPRRIHARMFTPRLTEDPATGSATAAMTGLLLAVDGNGAQRIELLAVQGEDMGRRSVLQATAARAPNGDIVATVGGRCVEVMRGTLVVGH